MNKILPIEFASLMASKICHDIISPIGAIVNGLEVLDEEPDEEMRSFAMDLIKNSAIQASAKLQFMRMAFGSLGLSDVKISLKDAEQIVINYISCERSEIEWNAPEVLVPKNEVKLLLNLIVIAVNSLPRGGKIVVQVDSDPDTRFAVVCKGVGVKISEKIQQHFSGESQNHVADVYLMQPIYTSMLAEIASMKISIERIAEEELTITCCRDYKHE